MKVNIIQMIQTFESTGDSKHTKFDKKDLKKKKLKYIYAHTIPGTV